MEHSIGYYVKAILDHANPAIAILGALSLICSAIFNLTYLINIDGRALFMMTLSDYLSLSISTIPMVLVPLVFFGFICASYIIPFHAFSWLESKKALSSTHILVYAVCFISVVTFGFLTISTEFAVLLIPVYMMIAATPMLGLVQKEAQPTNKFLWFHTGLTLIYLLMFGWVLLSGELRPLVSVAILLLILEAWILMSTYRRSNTLFLLTIYLCHGLNFILFLPLYSGYAFAKSDTSEDSKLPRIEVKVRDGRTLEDMIALRGMERGMLLWDGKRTVFLPWRSISSMSEATNRTQ